MVVQAPRTGARSTVQPTTNRQSIESRARRWRLRCAAWDRALPLTASVRFPVWPGVPETVPESVLEVHGADMRYRTRLPFGRTTSHRPRNSLTF